MTTDLLEGVLDDASALFVHAGEPGWSRALDVLKSECAATGGDQKAVREVLALFGGMGSFSDLVLYRNGKVLAQEDQRLDALRREIFALAQSTL